MYSDDSSTGFAGFEINTVNGILHGVWTSEESAKSSTWREMMAVCRCLGSLSNVLAYQRVKWFSDNKGVTSIVHKGSMEKELQDIALEIFSIFISKSIYLEMEWIPRSDYYLADYYSKIMEDSDDWGLSLRLFDMIQSQFGSF